MHVVARWCATHRLVVVGLWLLVLAATVGPEFFPAGPGHPAVALAEVYPVGSPQDQSTANLVTDLRANVIPGALHGQHLQVLVGGATAIGNDVAAQLSPSCRCSSAWWWPCPSSC
jgi:hypothetical protein